MTLEEYVKTQTSGPDVWIEPRGAIFRASFGFYNYDTLEEICSAEARSFKEALAVLEIAFAAIERPPTREEVFDGSWRARS